MLVKKAKDQQNQVGKPELLAFAFNFGGLAEWSNAIGLHPIDGGLIAVQGFESLTRRLLSLPGDGWNHHQGEKRTGYQTSSGRIDRRSKEAMDDDRGLPSMYRPCYGPTQV